MLTPMGGELAKRSTRSGERNTDKFMYRPWRTERLRYKFLVYATRDCSNSEVALTEGWLLHGRRLLLARWWLLLLLLLLLAPGADEVIGRRKTGLAGHRRGPRCRRLPGAPLQQGKESK